MREAVAGSENNYLEVFVGRGPATKVADARCSRKQLAMVADTQKCRLYFSLVHSESYDGCGRVLTNWYREFLIFMVVSEPVSKQNCTGKVLTPVL